MNWRAIPRKQIEKWIEAGYKCPYDLVLALAKIEGSIPRPVKASDLTDLEFILRVKNQEEREKVECRESTNRAIKAGILERQPCEVCGVDPADCHHADYGNPLNVVWLCKKHHAKEHVRLRRDQRIAHQAAWDAEPYIEGIAEAMLGDILIAKARWEQDTNARKDTIQITQPNQPQP